MDIKTLIAAGDALARSIGHSTHCPKVSSAIPCICQASREQAKCLDEWLYVIAEYKREASQKE